MAAKEFKAVALDCADLSFGDTAWRCASQAFAYEHALWCPNPLKSGQQGYWHKLMFEQLWPARAKWEGLNAPAPRRMGEMGVASETTSRDFKIQVSIRFKPGSTKEGRLLVPLHQKLVLLRKSGVDIGSKIGNKEPPEFLDALMGHVMADPVRLPSSGKVCDRCVVQEQLRLRDSRDPFDGSPLTIDMLEPQDELRQRIVDWKAESKRRVGDGGEEHKLDDKEVRELISELGGDLDPEIVEMLLEADQLRAAGKRALKDTSSRRNWTAGEEEIADEEAEEAEEPEGQAWWDEDVQNLGAGRAAMPVAGQRVIDGRGMQEAAEEELGEAPIREGPKVLAVSPPTRVVMFQPGAGIRPFVFARVFDERASQEDVYENTARSSVCAALNGFNACLLCYGQTGSGKTHTMFGQSVACGGNAGAVVSQQSGSVMRSLRELFNAAAELEVSCGVVTQISVQYVQIYQDQVACLVTGAVVALREAVAGAPVLLQGATETPLESLVDASQLIANGEERKRYAETAMNHRSSRAHTVLAVKLSQRRGDLETTSQLHLVDLAGSERVKKSRAQGGRLIEAVGINSSLMVLGQCIKARVEDRNHVPYYESRLTLLLRSALGGNSRTAVVICCHKEDKHGDETLQALSFGERCAMVSNRVHAAMASSASEAAAAIDAALAECGRQIQGLEMRGKGHLPACDKLRKRHATLSRRRRELGGKVGAAEAVETEGSAESQ
jgi:kinesin family protein 5